MQAAAQITSIFGGLVGLLSALGVLAFGEPALLGGAGDGDNARLFGLFGVVIALAGITGGIAISRRPEWALPLLLMSAGAGLPCSAGVGQCPVSRWQLERS
jgi:hypothetical protein